MAVYHNQNKSSAITAVEFSPVVQGNFAFFYVDHPKQLANARKRLTETLDQKIITETEFNGNTVLVTQGDKTQAELQAALAADGDRFMFKHHSKGLTELAWPLRSALGIGGQCLQLTSSLMRGKKDWKLFTFATTNLVANGINVLFGAQQTEDIHRLRFLKSEVNDQLTPHLEPGQQLPDPTEHRLSLRREQTRPLTRYERSVAFLRHHSVTLGELGLRYIGALSLATDKAPLRHYAGLGSITGKTTALLSKAPDPYDPNPHTAIDTFREQYSFRLGGLTEAASFLTLSYDAFAHNKIQFRGKEYRDYLSGIGAAMFTLGYIIRSWAKFGVKNPNMDELYAHVSDSLAKTPPQDLPKLMADTSAYIATELKDKELDFGKVFTQLTTDLYRYHQISLDRDKPAVAKTPVQKPEHRTTPAHNRYVSSSTPSPIAINFRERVEMTPATMVQR